LALNTGQFSSGLVTSKSSSVPQFEPERNIRLPQFPIMISCEPNATCTIIYIYICIYIYMYMYIYIYLLYLYSIYMHLIDHNCSWCTSRTGAPNAGTSARLPKAPDL
jgi:hypothetical protein